MTDYINPYSESRRWLRGNLHAHTCCGTFMEATTSAEIFARLNYDFLAITDHNKTPDEATLKAWQAKAALILLPGEENGDTDHMLEIGVHEVSPVRNPDYAEKASSLRKGGGFVAGCHPQEYDDGNEKIFKAAGILHGFEIFNGLRDGRGCNEAENVRLWDHVLTEGRKIWAVATDDFHCAYVTPGHGWVSVQAPEDGQPITWQFIVSQLKAGAFFASTYPGFNQITLKDGVLRASMTSQRLTTHVIGPGGKILHSEEGHNLEWKTLPDLPYFRIEVHSGTKRGWSQPFFARN